MVSYRPNNDVQDFWISIMFFLAPHLWRLISLWLFWGLAQRILCFYISLLNTVEVQWWVLRSIGICYWNGSNKGFSDFITPIIELNSLLICYFFFIFSQHFYSNNFCYYLLLASLDAIHKFLWKFLRMNNILKISI